MKCVWESLGLCSTSHWLNIFFSLLNISVLTQFLKSCLLEVDTGSPGFRVMLALGSQGV